MKHRIVQIGFSYEVQRWGVVNYDGILDHDWKTVTTFWSEEEATAYIKIVEKYN